MGIGGPDRNTGGIGASPSAPAGGLATPTAQPTPTAAPTPVLYVVQPGDTLSGIASRFGVSLAELIDANRERLPDPDRLNIGDELIIPAVAPDGLSGGSPDPSLVVP